MSKTFFNHHIIDIKGKDYVELKDYVNLQDRLFEVLDYIKFINSLSFEDKYVEYFIKDIMNHVTNLVINNKEE